MKTLKKTVKFEGREKEIDVVDIERIFDPTYKRLRFYHKERPLAKKLENTIKRNIHLKYETESINSFALRIAKSIVLEYEKNMFNDMVYNHKPFEFPRKDFGMLCIAPTKKQLLDEWKGDGNEHRCKAVLLFKERGIIESNKVNYEVRIKRPWFFKVLNEIKSGITYKRVKINYDKEKIEFYKRENERIRRVYFFNKK